MHAKYLALLFSKEKPKGGGYDVGQMSCFWKFYALNLDAKGKASNCNHSDYFD